MKTVFYAFELVDDKQFAARVLHSTRELGLDWLRVALSNQAILIPEALLYPSTVPKNPSDLYKFSVLLYSISSSILIGLHCRSILKKPLEVYLVLYKSSHMP